jgi:hypothetical protein
MGVVRGVPCALRDAVFQARSLTRSLTHPSRPFGAKLPERIRGSFRRRRACSGTCRVVRWLTHCCHWLPRSRVAPVLSAGHAFSSLSGKEGGFDARCGRLRSRTLDVAALVECRSDAFAIADEALIVTKAEATHASVGRGRSAASLGFLLLEIVWWRFMSVLLACRSAARPIGWSRLTVSV